MTRYDALIIGAGFAGSVVARELTDAGQKVLVVDKRDHVGGNAHDYVDEKGVLVPKYGAHLFHTNAPKVEQWLSRFTDWLPYEHRVLAGLQDRFVPVPINRTTVNRVFGTDLRTEADVARYLGWLKEDVPEIRNSEDAVVSQVGRTLYDLLFRDYTRKQWGRDPSELDASVCQRIPVRHDDDDRYFTDRFQAMPADGYTAMFDRILDGIEVMLGVEYAEAWIDGTLPSAKRIVCTGPIDEFFEYRAGRLPYRSLRFEHRHEPTPNGGLTLPAGVVNWPDRGMENTRTLEPRHWTGQVSKWSALIDEFPASEGEPYYPVPTPESAEVYRRYARLAAQRRERVTFVGRLARYQYLNMDQVVAQALVASRNLTGTRT